MAPKSDSNTQGGGFRGGPKRWTGSGPRPARHIPWPELFKHHQSVLTGHLKMMDMVRKHCVEGTGNYTTAKACIERTQEMMKMFKEVTWNFVPPKDNIDRVPLGASSASMYPGYSPADHIYGEAAQEYGQYAAERKRQGIELEADPNGPQYEVGQSRRAGQSQGASEEPDVSHAEISDPKEQAVQNDETLGEPMEGVLQSDNASQYFVIDTKPTPREELPNFISQSAPRKSKDKRRVSFVEEENIPDKNGDSRERKRKRSKITNQEDNTVALQSRQPAEDLSTEVEARLQAKEEKKKRREEKKRSRDSSDTTVGVDANGTVSVESIGKVKKAKHKHDRSNTEGGNEATLEFHQDAKREKRKKKRPGVESSTA